MTWLPMAIFLLALFVTTVAAIGARVLMYFSHRQLEVHCRLRKKREIYEHIIDTHDQVATAVEGLLVLGLITAIASGTILLSDRLANGSVFETLGWLGLAALLLSAILVWIPGAVTRDTSAPVLACTWGLWRAIYWVFWPANLGQEYALALYRRLAGKPKQSEKDEDEEAFEDEILTMVTSGEREGLLEADAADMIEGVMELDDNDVNDIMTPRSRVDYIDVNQDWSEILEIAIDSGRTRLPVCDGTLDKILGVLYVKDLLPEVTRASGRPARSLRELMRPPWRIPATKPVDDLLQEFRTNRNHLAIVIDEFQTVLGVVTIEDVLEEIVGEIVDESDKDEEDGIRQLSETTFEVVGDVHVDHVNERLELDLPEGDDFDTIAGYMLSRLGYIPKPGESIQHGDARITVTEARPQAIDRLEVEVAPPESGSPENRSV